MVLINDKKFACATCIKGHRVSGCTHSDRPLFEVKKKGRPATQCHHCREKRKGATGVVHTRCACGDPKATPTILSGASETSRMSSSPSDRSPTPTLPATSALDSQETRKGVPGSTPTYPNGLKDVHDMAAAAEALSVLGGDGRKVAERKFQNLLNPCTCMTSGVCKCCQPKREPRDRNSPRRSPSSGASVSHRDPTGHAVTESLIEMFQTKATTAGTPPEPASSTCCSTPTGAPPNSEIPRPTWAQLMVSSDPHLSPENMHHPAHTSPHVHKTKLYSPYTTNGHVSPRHGVKRDPSFSATGGPSGWASASTITTRPAPPEIRPLADMNIFLGAMFKEDGTVASEIPRSAVGLPGIQTFHAIAGTGTGGAKAEAMQMDVDQPLTFPTAEDVVIGACTCGNDCECSGCATHGTASRSAENGHSHAGACGEGCKSTFDCSDHLSLPSGITSIDHLLSLAAANVPTPARSHLSFELDAHDTRILPPAVGVSEDAARNMGIVQLKPLECCSGRCQCAPGNCTCDKDCCGCCSRCLCGDDEDAKMTDESSAAPEASVEPTTTCCGTSPTAEPSEPPQSSIPSNTATPVVQPIVPSASQGVSPAVSGVSTPTGMSSAPALPHSASATRDQPTPDSHPNLMPNRRVTTAPRSAAPYVQRSASNGKSVSKALAVHSGPAHHPHPRPILPKPPNHPSTSTNLAPPKACASGNSKCKPPIADRVSGQCSTASPAQSGSSAGLTHLPKSTTASLGQSSMGQQTAPSLSVEPSNGGDSFAQMNLGDAGWLDLANDADLMALLNSLTNDGTSVETLAAPVSTTVSSNSSGPENALPTPDFPYDQTTSDLGSIDQSDNFFQLLVQSMQSAQTTTLPDSGGMAATPAPFQNRPIPGDDPSSLFNSFHPMTDVSQSVPRAGLPQLNRPDFQPNVSDGGSGSGSSIPSGMLHPDLRSSFGPGKPNQPVMLNPNLIDLSRPLDASDVERILQALQFQQQRQQAMIQQEGPSVSGSERGSELSANPQDGYGKFGFDPAVMGGVQPWLAELGAADPTRVNEESAGRREQTRLLALLARDSTGL